MEKLPRVINTLFAGHAQHGKSSLIQAICGVFPDNLDFELDHGTTVNLKIIQFEIKSSIFVNLIDTAGHSDFKASPALGLEFADLLVLVVSGSEGFQARTYWLYEKAKQRNIPIIIAATKMDLPSANVSKIEKELYKLKDEKIPIIQTSAKTFYGIENLITKIGLYTRNRRNINEDSSFIILGFDNRKGLGNLINVGILTGQLEPNKFLSVDVKIKAIFSLNKKPLNRAFEGDIVQLLLNVNPIWDLGTKYFHGKFISPKIDSLLADILPRKEYLLEINDVMKFKLSLQIIDDLKKLIPFDYYIEKNIINLLVTGDLLFEFIKERLEDLIEFRVIGSKIKGVITINRISSASYKTASVRILPRSRKSLTVSREYPNQNKMYDLLAATAALEAFHLDGLHVDVFSGKNEDHISQAIAKAIEKIKIIKIVPFQDIIVKVENYHDLFLLIERFNIELLYQSKTDTFFLQVKNDIFEEFFNSLMKISKGKAEIHLFKFDQSDKILAVDPGTRHFGFSLIEKGEIPLLWYVNLKKNIEDNRTHNIAKKHLQREMDIFLKEGKELINKIFIGNGPGSSFILEFLIEYFDIPHENHSCIKTDLKHSEPIKMNQVKSNFEIKPPEVYLVDEFKTSKEALFHLQQGKLINEVKTKGFVDHAIAALLIAKRGLKGEVIEIRKKPLKQLYDYIIENYAGSSSFSSIHNMNNLDDLKKGMYLRIKDVNKLDSTLRNGEVISFSGFGDAYSSLHAINLSGNKVIIKFQGDVKIKRDFFKIFIPVKERF